MLRHFAERRGIRFPLLSDLKSETIRAFGLLNESIPTNTPFFGVPHPVTLWLDASGKVVSKHVEEDYRQRYTAANILVERMNLRTGASESVIETPHLRLVSSASNATVRPGERIRLVVDIKLVPKMHVYAPGVAGYIPIDWKLEGVKDFGVTYPRARTLHLKAINERVPVYERAFSLQREVLIDPKAAAGDLTIRGSLRYQACDDRKCYLPETLALAWTLKVERHDSTRAPEELRRK